MAKKKNKPAQQNQPFARENFTSFLATMEGESDRGALLVGLSLIDDGLGALLAFVLSKGSRPDSKWLLNQTAGNRPLGSLAIRTRMARCLDLIDDELRNVIDEIRSVRNAHAHGTMPFALGDDDVHYIMESWSEDHKETVNSSIPSTYHSLAREQLITSICLVAILINRKLSDLRDNRVDIEVS
jgi:hypothetical protein